MAALPLLHLESSHTSTVRASKSANIVVAPDAGYKATYPNMPQNGTSAGSSVRLYTRLLSSICFYLCLFL